MFFTDGKLRGLEKFMQLPKYPTKKGGGKYRGSYHYTKGDCNCVNCLHWKKKYGCSQKVCPFIQERIDCGACTFDVGRILRTFKIKKNVEVTDNGKIII